MLNATKIVYGIVVSFGRLVKTRWTIFSQRTVDLLSPKLGVKNLVVVLRSPCNGVTPRDSRNFRGEIGC